METYGHILLIAMPAFLLFVLGEKFYAWKRKKIEFRNMDTISSLSSGITNVTKDVLGLTLTLLSYHLLVDRLAIIHISAGWFTYLVAFLVLDFAGYWVHRWSHHLNVFWNLHLIHHSSEEFNLACALRQSISTFVNIFTFLLIPAALLGVPAEVIAVVAPLHLFAQFWYHTEHIGKLGWLEYIIVTPSHHRVHHAINPEYLDKNLGQIFIFWDRLFNTFQEELKEVPPVYGITRPVRTWNPVRINFQHFWLLLKDSWRTKNWNDKFMLWFKPTGYRPKDMIEKYPVYKIDNVYSFEKYYPSADKLMVIWSWTSMGLLLAFLSYLFGNIAAINQLDSSFVYWYGLFIFLYVYALTELMDRRRYAWIWELAKACLGCWFLWNQNDWFGLSNYLNQVPQIMISCLLFSFIMSLWICLKQNKTDRSLEPASL